MRRLARVVLLGGVLGLAGVGLAPAGAGAQAAPPTVIVYGDSVMTESQAWVAANLSQKSGWRVVVHQYPGTALCDWLPTMRGSDASLNARLVILAFSGDSLTPCSQRYGSQWWVAWYYDSAGAADLWRSRGVRVLFATAPGNVMTNQDPALAGIDSTIAQRYGEFYANTGQVLRRADNWWPVYLPCAPWETNASYFGCGKWPAPPGMVQVRRSTQNGHLCRVDSGLNPCAVYSSGVFRWAGAIGNAGKPLMY